MTLPLYTFDWGHGKKLQCVGPKGVLDTFNTLEELVTRIEPCLLVGEKSFVSFKKQNRAFVITTCRQRGIDFRVFDPRHTKAYEWGEKEDADSDLRDAWKIYFAVKQGVIKHLQSPKLAEEIIRPERLFVDQINAIIREETSPEETLALLPPPEMVPMELRELLVKGKKKLKYNISYAAPFAIAATHAGNRSEFERLVGCYAEGFPNILRSRFYHYAVKTLVGGGTKKNPKPPKRSLKDAMRLARKAIRWVYHEVSENCGQKESRNGQVSSPSLATTPRLEGNIDPETGSLSPRASAHI